MQININEKEHKVGKASGKPYMRFNTSQGWMSCFDKDLCEKLSEVTGTGVPVEVEVKEKGDFKNIVAMIGIAEDNPTKPSDNKTFAKAPTATTNDKATTMYTSYAKDIYVSMNKDDTALTKKALMDEAISLVKQAQKAFS